MYTNSVIQEQTEHESAFDTVGTLPYEYEIKLKEGSQPVIHPPHRVPVPLKKDVKREVDRNGKNGYNRKDYRTH